MDVGLLGTWAFWVWAFWVQWWAFWEQRWAFWEQPVGLLGTTGGPFGNWAFWEHGPFGNNQTFTIKFTQKPHPVHSIQDDLNCYVFFFFYLVPQIENSEGSILKICLRLI